MYISQWGFPFCAVWVSCITFRELSGCHMSIVSLLYGVLFVHWYTYTFTMMWPGNKPSGGHTHTNITYSSCSACTCTVHSVWCTCIQHYIHIHVLLDNSMTTVHAVHRLCQSSLCFHVMSKRGHYPLFWENCCTCTCKSGCLVLNHTQEEVKVVECMEESS